MDAGAMNGVGSTDDELASLSVQRGWEIRAPLPVPTAAWVPLGQEPGGGLFVRNVAKPPATELIFAEETPPSWPQTGDAFSSMSPGFGQRGWPLGGICQLGG